MNIAEQHAKKHAQHVAEDDAGREATAKVLPGPTANAFAPVKSIMVDRYEVRPFCDADFELMQHLENPIQNLIAMCFDGEKMNNEQYNLMLKKLSRGQNAWNLCYVLTNPAEQVDTMVQNEGLLSLALAAKKEFRNLQTAAVIKIVEACLEQFYKSWETMVGIGAPEDKSKEVASPTSPP